MNNRYIVVPPVDTPNGDPWWTIADTQSEVMPNFGVITIFKDFPEAEKIAYGIASRANQEGGK